MLKKYFEKVKIDIFPEIENWDSDNPLFSEIAAEKNVNKLPYKYWFFFHPTAYNFIYYGVFVIAIIMFVITALIIKHYFGAFGIIPGLLVLLLAYKLIKSIMSRKERNKMTFGDMWLKDDKDT